MTAEDNDWKERQRLHDRTRDDLLKRQLSNSENADRAILTVSAAALAFSLTIAKDMVQLPNVEYVGLLHFSWLCFGLATLSTLMSFFTSQRAVSAQLVLAERYYLKYDEAAATIRPRSAAITEWLNRTGAVCLAVGIFALSFCVYVNQGKDPSMTKRVPVLDGASVPTLQKISSDVITRGASIPSMQPVQPQGGAPVPTMQKPPEPPPSSGGTSGK